MTNDQRVVWILGAGFSRSLGGPLLPELITTAATRRSLALYPSDFMDHERVVATSYVYEQGARLNSRHQEPLWEHAEEFLERLELACPWIAGWEAEWTTLRDFMSRLHRNQEWQHTRKLAGLDDALPKLCELPDARALRACALQLLAAQCCGFLENANPDTERWLPYRRWADSLQTDETIITFNYDRVVELLDKEDEPKICCYPLPNTTRALRADKSDRRPLVLKLHGSVDWTVEDGRLTIAMAEKPCR